MNTTLHTQTEGCLIQFCKGIGILILFSLAYFIICWIFNSPGFTP